MIFTKFGLPRGLVSLGLLAVVVAYPTLLLFDFLQAFRQKIVNRLMKVTVILGILLVITAFQVHQAREAPCGLTHLAWEGKNLHIRILLAMGSDVNAPLCKTPPIVRAARTLSTIQLLIAHGADVDVQGKLKRTPLHLSAIVSIIHSVIWRVVWQRYT